MNLERFSTHSQSDRGSKCIIQSELSIHSSICELFLGRGLPKFPIRYGKLWAIPVIEKF